MMDKRAIRLMVKQLGIYLCNNIPFSDIEIRKNLLQCLVGLAGELGIDFEEFCKLINVESASGTIKN